jgi:PPM family protein phosphatase
MALTTSQVFSAGDDREGVYPEQILIVPRLGLVAVADAPGSGEDGRAGLRIALEGVRAHLERNEDILQRFARTPTAELRARILGLLEEGYARAAQELFAFARRRPNVLVTLDVVLIAGTEAFVAHIGDGRVYLVRRGLVHQLTVDHSRAEDPQVFDLLGNTPDDSAGSAGTRRFTRSLGPQPHVRIESLCMELAAEDRFVVTTAHLYRALPEGIIGARITAERLADIGAALIDEAGPDAALVAGCAQVGSGDPYSLDSAAMRLAILAPMPLFAHCTERELRSIAQATRPRTFPRDTVLFEEGQPGTELYLVISGTVDIVKNGQIMAHFGPGSSFGEMAMLDEPGRSATAVAGDDCELLVIPRDAFFAMLRGNSGLAVKILWNMLLRLSANLRTTSERLAEVERRFVSRAPVS